ncbi:MAG: EutN/CcmL family microcompartment protein [Candidatus Caldatribacteriaceae bacterium]
MLLGRVVGTVVATRKSDGVTGGKYFLVSPCDTKGQAKGDYLVALDLVGCGAQEMVLLAQGSSARQAEVTKQRAIDCVIVGIVDLVEENGQIVFQKNKHG